MMSKHKAMKQVSRRKKWLKRVAVAAILMLLAAALGALYAYKHFEGNIKAEEFIESTPEAPRPEALPQTKGALNILVMGSDGRKGTGVAGETPGLSDTTMLMHIAKDRSYAYSVSIPRDAMVDRPACPRRSGSGVDEGGLTQFNSAFAVGGPPCTVATVEQLTGVRVDHFIVVDFNGFRAMVNAVGGVSMCVPEPVNDPVGDIYLKAGTYTMKGDTALDYVRVRHGIGSELGDIGRMKRQQAFIASLSEKVMSSGTLANPVRLLKLLEATTKSLTTDPELKDLRKLAGIANSLQGVGLSEIQFITAPFELWEVNRNRVVVTAEAEGIWEAMRRDRRLPATATGLITPEKSPGNSTPTKKKPESKAKGGLTTDDKASYGLCS